MKSTAPIRSLRRSSCKYSVIFRSVSRLAASWAMTPRLVTLIRLLRTQGLPLSVPESLDALHSVSCVGLHDRELLRLTLRTALVKSHQDFATFDTLFERFFTLPRRRRRR